MKFEELKDDHGTHLATFAEMLAEKARAAGLLTFLFFSPALDAPEGVDGMHAVSNIDSDVAQAFVKVGNAILKQREIDAVNQPTLVNPPKIH